MKFRDHSFRNKKPDYNISLQLTYTEMDELLGDITGHFPDWHYEDCILAQFAEVLAKEGKTRSLRKPNPGWIGHEGSPIDPNTGIAWEGP